MKENKIMNPEADKADPCGVLFSTKSTLRVGEIACSGEMRLDGAWVDFVSP